MKLKEAIELGKTCGLETIEECVNNVIIHSTMLLSWDKLNEELLELKKEAEAIGIKFCKRGHAKFEDKCYICENFYD